MKKPHLHNYHIKGGARKGWGGLEIVSGIVRGGMEKKRVGKSARETDTLM